MHVLTEPFPLFTLCVRKEPRIMSAQRKDIQLLTLLENTNICASFVKIIKGFQELHSFYVVSLLFLYVPAHVCEGGKVLLHHLNKD